MAIVSGYQKMKDYIKQSSGYKLLSRWANANTIECDDAQTVQNKIGGITGISSSLTANSSTQAASTQLTNQLYQNIARINIYVGSDGKLHFTDKDGADSVLPFSLINAVENISSKLTAYASQNHGFRSTESLTGYKYVIVCATYQGGKSANFTTFSGCSCMIQTGWDAGGWTNEGIGVHSNHLCILTNITGVIDVYASSTGTGYTSVRAFALS